MSEKERDRIVNVRRTLDIPFHAPPHSRDGFDTYHISAACYEHRPLFQHPDDLTYLMEQLLDSLQSESIHCIAWVFLPDHYHVLVEADEIDDIGEALRLSHSDIATRMNKKDDKKGRKVWYRYTDRGIRNNDHYWATINYIHHNPVKDNFVDQKSDWPWSSYDRFREKFGEEKLKRIWDAHPIDRFDEGWDGESS